MTDFPITDEAAFDPGNPITSGDLIEDDDAPLPHEHFVIDRWRLAKHVGWAKNQLAPRRYRPAHTATGYGADKPDWMAVWLLIITDNVMHLAINRWALRRWSGVRKDQP